MRTRTLPVRARILGPALLVLVAACGGGRRFDGAVSPALNPALEPVAETEARSAMADGQRAGPALAGVAYGPGQATDWTVSLQASACYAFGFSADASVTRLSMLLYEPSGRRVAAARVLGNTSVLYYCAPVSGPFRLEGKVLAGGGHFVVVGYSKGGAAGQASAFVISGPAASAVAVGGPAAPPAPTPGGAPAAAAGLDIPTAIDKQAAVAAVGASRLGDFFTGVGDQSDWAAQLSAGTCYWFIGAGDASKTHGLTLSLWDPHGAPLAQGRSDSQVATLAYCAREAGSYRFEAKVNGGNPAKADYKVAVYAK
jgi:hypothetical protein